MGEAIPETAPEDGPLALATMDEILVELRNRYEYFVWCGRPKNLQTPGGDTVDKNGLIFGLWPDITVAYGLLRRLAIHLAHCHRTDVDRDN